MTSALTSTASDHAGHDGDAAVAERHVAGSDASPAPDPGDVDHLVDPTRIAGRSRRSSVPLPRAIKRMTGPVLLLVAWYVVTELELVGVRTLPPPGDVYEAAKTLIRDGDLQAHMWASLGRIARGSAFGMLVGTGLAVFAGLSRIGENIVDVNMEILRAIPNFSLLPLLIGWYGIGETPKVILIAMTVAIAIYINTYSAIRNVDAGLVEAARSFGVRRFELVRRVVLPGSLPGFFVGLRIALTGAWLALIFAESIAAAKGLGKLMNDAREYFDIEVLFVVITVYAVLGILSLAIVRMLESRMLTWRRAYDGG